jgi:predicted O-methyltransferase YrrM
MSFTVNLQQRLRLLQIACTRRYIWTDLTAMVMAHGFELRDVRANLHPLRFARNIPGLTSQSAVPVFAERLGKAAAFELADSFAWNSEPSVSEFLGELVFRRRARTIVELGCFVGWTSAHLALGMQVSGADGRLWCIDTDERFLSAARRNLERRQLASNVTFVCGRSLDASVLSALPTSIDLVFIDTSHEYQDTLEEISAYAARLASGGCIALHDTISQDGCRRALRDCWSDFATLTFATEFGNGLTVLQRLT